MAVERRVLRGTTAQMNAFTGGEGAITVDTTKKTAVIHDGTTAGGFPLAHESHTHVYTDLVNLPTIPTATSDLTNDSGFITAADVPASFSGDYNDLTNKPALFSGDYTALINKPSIPATTSQLTNDSGFITAADVPASFSGSYNDLSDKPTLFSGNYADLTNKPTIPSATSALTNDSGFITASDIPASFSGDYADLTNVPTTFAPSAHTHAIADVTGLQAELDAKAVASNVYSKAETDSKIAGIVNSAPEALNTLNELAAALGNDANFATTVSTQIGQKANSADLAVVATSGSYNDLTDKPTSVDPAIISYNQDYASVSAIDKFNWDNKADAVHYHSKIQNESDNTNIRAENGMIGGGVIIATVDNTDYFYMQNGGINLMMDTTIEAGKTLKIGSDDVALAKNIPTATSDLTNDSGFITAADVPASFSGSYTDLTNKPATFTPSAHTHTIENVTGLQSALDAKANSTDVYTKTEVDGKISAGDTAAFFQTSGTATTFDFLTMNFGGDAGNYLANTTWDSVGGGFMDDGGVGLQGLPMALYNMSSRINTLEQNAGGSGTPVSVRETIYVTGNGGITLEIGVFNTFYHVMDQASEQLWASAGTVGIDDTAVLADQVVHFTVRVKMSENEIPNREMTFGGVTWIPVGPATFNYNPGAENIIQATYWANTETITYTIFTS